MAATMLASASVPSVTGWGTAVRWRPASRTGSLNDRKNSWSYLYEELSRIRSVRLSQRPSCIMPCTACVQCHRLPAGLGPPCAGCDAGLCRVAKSERPCDRTQTDERTHGADGRAASDAGRLDQHYLCGGRYQ